MKRRRFERWYNTIAFDVQLIHWERLAGDYWHRRDPKQPLQPHQTGRTHKRKPRGSRKPINMSFAQFKIHVTYERQQIAIQRESSK